MSPAPPLPDQQQSLNRNDKLRRLSVAPSIRLILCSLYSSIRATHTHTHRQPARRPVCVCQWEERGGRGEHDCPFMWGRGHFFQSRGIFFFFSLLGTCNFTSYNQREPRPQHTTLLIGYSPEALPQHTTLLDTVLRPLPFRLTTPQWIQSRGPAPS